jgi:hypothetical protein
MRPYEHAAILTTKNRPLFHYTPPAKKYLAAPPSNNDLRQNNPEKMAERPNFLNELGKLG